MFEIVMNRYEARIWILYLGNMCFIFWMLMMNGPPPSQPAARL